MAATNHQVEIFAQNGKISYTNATVNASKGDTISWTSNHPFAVDFAVSSPADKLKGSSKKGKASSEISMKIRNDSSPGRYKYFVAVFDGNDVLTDDPEIIIEF